MVGVLSNGTYALAGAAYALPVSLVLTVIFIGLAWTARVPQVECPKCLYGNMQGIAWRCVCGGANDRRFDALFHPFFGRCRWCKKASTDFKCQRCGHLIPLTGDTGRVAEPLYPEKEKPKPEQSDEVRDVIDSIRRFKEARALDLKTAKNIEEWAGTLTDDIDKEVQRGDLEAEDGRKLKLDVQGHARREIMKLRDRA